MEMNSFICFTGGINMIKKIVASTIMLAILGTSNVLSYAAPIATPTNKSTDTKNANKKIEEVKQSFEVVIPEKDAVTSDKNLVLSFKAPQDTKVSIEVYHNVSKDDETEKYELSYDPIEVTVGSIQMGWAEIELQPGLNKIEFKAKYKDGSEDSVVRIVNVMDVQEVKQLLEEIVNKSTLGIGKKP